MNPSTETEPCCSDLELDQLLLDELPPEHASRLRAHVAASPRCQARLAALDTVKRAWAERAPPFVPPAAAPSTNVVALDAVRSRRLRLASQGMAAFAAAAAVVVLVQRSTDDGVRTKGPGLTVALTQSKGGRAVDVFAGDAIDAAVPVVAHAKAQAGVHVAVVVDARVVARGVADAAGVVDVAFRVDRAGDVVVVACHEAIDAVVDDVDDSALAGCSRDTFALRVGK
jgi:hypothetical protein